MRIIFKKNKTFLWPSVGMEWNVHVLIFVDRKSRGGEDILTLQWGALLELPDIKLSPVTNVTILFCFCRKLLSGSKYWGGLLEENGVNDISLFYFILFET